MKKATRFLVSLLLGLLILASIFWYLFIYDRAFTRDTLLSPCTVTPGCPPGSMTRPTASPVMTKTLPLSWRTSTKKAATIPRRS